MRVIHIVSALSGACALLALAASAHLLHDEEASRWVMIGGALQLATALAGLAIANRTGAMNLIAGAIMLAGATLIAGEIYFHAFLNNASLEMLAPIGGGSLIIGWIVLAFAKPR